MNAHILIVEDNEALAENMAELFTDEGADVRMAATAPAALEEARARGFDLAIVDVRLPDGVSGLDLAPSLREHSTEGELILVTGNATLDTAIAAVRHGAFAYVLKPFDPGDLLALGKRALSQVALRREREGLARELARSEALYRGVVDAVEALFIGFDAQGRIALCNRFTGSLTGFETERLAGRRLSDLATNEHEAQAYDRLIERALRGGAVGEAQLSIRTHGGDKRVVRWTLVPLEAGPNAPVLLARGVDVTERLALQARTAESEAMAAIGRLTAGLAHEIRNPLNAAKLQLEVLARQARRLESDDAARKIEERVDLVREELLRVASLAEEFLSLARPLALEREPVDLCDVVREVVELQTPVAAEAGVTIEPVTDELPEGILADRARIKQVLINLIANAIEAMRSQDGGTVRIECRTLDSDYVEVRVADTGPGIDPAVADQIFQAFVTTKEAGTGLGLNIVKKLVELHGGEVEVHPRPGGGTVARFTLPTSS